MARKKMTELELMSKGINDFREYYKMLVGFGLSPSWVSFDDAIAFISDKFFPDKSYVTAAVAVGVIDFSARNDGRIGIFSV